MKDFVFDMNYSLTTDFTKVMPIRIDVFTKQSKAVMFDFLFAFE